MALRGAVYVNGIIKPAAEAVVPVYDHGFLYGEGLITPSISVLAVPGFTSR